MIPKIALVVVIAGITYLSLTPTNSVDLGNDKVGHFVAYSVLTMNLGIIVHPVRKKILLAGLFAFIYGGLMEFGQYFVPGRVVSFYDLLANATGVLIGLAIILTAGNWIHNVLRKTRII